MVDILSQLQNNRHHYFDLLMNDITEYTYREDRYTTNFSVLIVFTPTSIKENEITKTLRNTDKYIKINQYLFFIIFDSVNKTSYLKAAENFCKTLQSLHCHDKNFSSTVFSSEFHANYLDMTNKLFERLQYAIKHDIYNCVVYQDYII